MASNMLSQGPVRFLPLVFPLVVSVGCTVSPQPEPPNFSPEALTLTSDDQLSGAAGAVRSGEGVLWILDIKGTGAPLQTPVRPDGSFGPLDVSGLAAGGQLLFQPRPLARPWPDPVPLERMLPGDSLVEPTLTFPCLTVSATQLDLGDVPLAGGPVSRSITVDNGCAMDLEAQLSPVPFRLMTGLAGAPATTPVGAGARATIDITFTPMAPGFAEEVVLFEIRDPMAPMAAPERPVVLIADVL